MGASVALSGDTAYILVARVTATEVRLALFGAGVPVYAAGVAQGSSSGSQDLSLGKIHSSNPDSRAVVAQVLLYGRALTDGEVATLGAKLRTDYGLATCTKHEECADGNACTNDFCDQPPGAPRVCKYDPLTNPSQGICSDADPCSTNESCDKGVCKGNAFKSCDDSNPCTADVCNKATGQCASTAIEPSGTKCDDGNPCTVPDTCSGAVCVHNPRVCQDNNPCTADSCDKAAGGCVFAANTAPCDDGNACTSQDTCSNKACKGAPNQDKCDDSHPCTVDEHCKDGACSDVKPVVCPDDGNACTVEGCTYWAGCKVESIKTCADANPCTDDACDVKTGTCVYKPNQAQCSDGSVCTVGDACSGGKCNLGAALHCDDGVVCTNDTCDKAKGCVHTNVQSCEDGNACTEKDFCVFGQCLGGAPPSCDDGNLCTTDFCSVAQGCQHKVLADGSACGDGLECTVGDACKAGACQIGETVCDFAVTSTSDSGAGSLREALVAAEAAQQSQWAVSKNAGSKSIGVFVSGVVKLKSSLPLLAFAKVIDGRSANLVVDGAGAHALLDSYADLTLRNLKLYSGWRVNKQGDYVRGAAVSVRRTVSQTDPVLKLVVDGCTIYGSTSDVQGGAIFAHGATVEIRNSVISLNARSAAPDASKGGGAVAIETDGSAGPIRAVIKDSRFEYNQGEGLGGALWCGPDTECTLQRSSFYANKGWKGILAVDAKAKATLVNVAFESNEALDVGGVIRSDGELTLLHVTVTTTSVKAPADQPVVYANGKTRILNSLLARNGQLEDAIDCALGPAAVLDAFAATTIGVSPPYNFIGKPTKTIEGALAVRCGAAQPPHGNIGTPKLLTPVDPALKVSHYARVPKGSPDRDGADLPWCQVAGPDVRGAQRPFGSGCDRGAVEHHDQ